MPVDEPLGICRVIDAAGDVHWSLGVCCARAGAKKTAPAAMIVSSMDDALPYDVP